MEESERNLGNGLFLPSKIFIRTFCSGKAGKEILVVPASVQTTVSRSYRLGGFSRGILRATRYGRDWHLSFLRVRIANFVSPSPKQALCSVPLCKRVAIRIQALALSARDPQLAATLLHALARDCDEMWHHAGDTSADVCPLLRSFLMHAFGNVVGRAMKVCLPINVVPSLATRCD
jgi:hypothetical protein